MKKVVGGHKDSNQELVHGVDAEADKKKNKSQKRHKQDEKERHTFCKNWETLRSGIHAAILVHDGSSDGQNSGEGATYKGTR